MQGEGLTVGLLDWVDPTREWFKSRPDVARGLLGAAYQMATDPNARKEAMARQPAPFQEGSGQEMFSRAMDVGPQGLLGKIVYHGSPHKFDKFDASKIGTGEGAQAYGHGVYLADSENVAKGYARGLGKLEVNGKGINWEDPTHVAAAAVDDLGSMSKAADWLYREARRTKSDVQMKASTLLDGLIDSKVGANGLPKTNKGTLIKADLPDEWIPKMLDWDKTLPEQGNAALKTWFEGQKTLPGGYAFNEHTGKTLYEALRGRGISNDQVAATLKDAGIPGIRYLDGGSRSAGQGSYNYVVFPGLEDQVKILERNGMPISGLLGR